jgi:hypothetical protein
LTRISNSTVLSERYYIDITDINWFWFLIYKSK